ncbi:MAG: DUF4115 domain-containing protein [Glaciimonas sp.]|nr:DUF4115 domain-containing protein [Glaciimonas sp.]
MSEADKNSLNTSDEEVGMENGVTSAHTATGNHSVGAQLSHQRQQHGWSVDDVANQLKLSPRQIEAIETDNYAVLPTMVMTRGYIRSYAKLLGLDPATILPSAVSAAIATTDVLGATQRSGSGAKSLSDANIVFDSSRRFSYKWIVLGVAAVLAAILAMQFGGLLTLHQPLAVSATTEEKAHDVSSVALPAVASNATTTEVASPILHSEVNAVPAESVTTVTATTPIIAPVTGNNQLTLHFKQDSWVEIKGADKKILFSGIGKADATETIDIDQPVSVVIGNLAGVEATLRGEVLDLKASSKPNVARLSLQ